MDQCLGRVQEREIGVGPPCDRKSITMRSGLLAKIFRWDWKVIPHSLERLRKGLFSPCGEDALDGCHGHGGLQSYFLESLKDEDLCRLNDLLPWSCYVLDERGRRFGKPWSVGKRGTPQRIPDRRIVELDRRFPLRDLVVLEVGCFEGVHTVALARLARRVLAADSRVENVVKTIVRCAAYRTSPEVFVWNIEEGIPKEPDLTCDILHHVGVLYHLADPVRHLREILPIVKQGVMLDTHVASEDSAVDSYVSEGKPYRYMEYRERGRHDPFSGMAEHAKWIREEDVIGLLHESGFHRVEVAERRQERNGPRVLIFASRETAVRRGHGT